MDSYDIGYWVKEMDRNNHWHCNMCGRVEGNIHYTMRYCPTCGVKMCGEIEGKSREDGEPFEYPVKTEKGI